MTTVNIEAAADVYHTAVKSGEVVTYQIDFDPVANSTYDLTAFRRPGQPDNTKYDILFNGKHSAGSGELSQISKVTIKRGDTFTVTLANGTSQGVAVRGPHAAPVVKPSTR